MVCRLFLQPAPRGLKNRIILHGEDAGGVGPVLEDAALDEQAFEDGGRVSRESGRQDQVLVALDRGHGVELHALQAADHPKDAGGRGRPRRLIRCVDGQTLCREEKSPQALRADGNG